MKTTAPPMSLLILIVSMSALGALAHDAVGVVGASLLTLLVLPLLAGLVTMAWISRGNSSDLVRLMALRSACAVAILAPVLALPGTLLGWVGVSTLIFMATLAHNLSRGGSRD